MTFLGDQNTNSNQNHKRAFKDAFDEDTKYPGARKIRRKSSNLKEITEMVTFNNLPRMLMTRLCSKK